MAWVRIHDGALGHPKIADLVNICDPFALWIWGLSHSQMHLTNGVIVREVLPKQARPAAGELVKRRLWQLDPRGWKIHDFLHWNDSRAIVRRRQKKAKVRKKAWSGRQAERRSERVRNAFGTGNQTKPNQYVRTYPPTPLSGGRITRAERKQAEEIRRKRLRCPHEPRCPTAAACVLAVVDELHAQRKRS